MNKPELPELSPQASPEFMDAATAKAWLENVPLANVAAAQQLLLAQMQEFNRYAANAVSRLATLEALREAVQFVQIEQARRFTNRALPMAEAESAVFDDTLALWREMYLGYLRCLEAAVAGERVRATLRLVVAVRGGGTEILPLPASGAVTSATVDGAPATLGASPTRRSRIT